MPLMIKLTRAASDKATIMVNVDNIAYLAPFSETVTRIYFPGETHISVLENLDKIEDAISKAQSLAKAATGR